MTQFISKKDLLSWLSQLLEDRYLVAPTKVDELTLFRQVDRVDDIVFDFDNTNLSPKEWFFPPSETLFYVERKDGHVELIPATIERETAIFGIRPCDARGMAMNDYPFLAEPADALYRQHRDKTTLVGLACLTTRPECFCTSMGSGPHDPANLDILLTEVADGYIVQVLTDKGKALLPDKLITAADVSPPPVPALSEVPSGDISEKMRRAFDDPFWDRLADRCIHCNICSYVCPTCYCFDVRDYTDKERIERVRSWESCQSPGFTRIAGGYDPRPTKGSRLRQRFAHKLLYFPEQFGALGCVGCGRCVRACPVNIDIREIIQDVQQLGVKSEA